MDNRNAISSSLKPPVKKNPKTEKNKNSENIKANNLDVKKCSQPSKNNASLFTNRSEMNNHVPFEDIKDFAENNSPKFYSRNVQLSLQNYNNNYQSISNETSDQNVKSLSSPFKRSLTNNSQHEIMLAKKSATSLINTENTPRPLNKESQTVKKESYEQLLKEFCVEKGLIMPIYSISEKQISNELKFYTCNLTIGDGFKISTHPVETRTEMDARERASEKAYNHLASSINSLPSFLYDSENVIKLRDLCTEKNLQQPVFKCIECNPKNEPKYFICKVHVGKDILLSSYPTEAKDEFTARDLVAKKAYDHLNVLNKSVVKTSKNLNLVLSQLFDLVKSKNYGVWCNKLPSLYLETYKEELPSDWFELVKNCSKFEISSIPRVGHIIRVQNNMETMPKLSGSLELAKLKVPESNQWEVYITNVVSSDKIWCRLIGKNFSVSVLK